MLGTAYDKYLGGRDFDDVLVDKFTLEFNEKHKFDLNKNAKSKFRLRSACEKVKKVLSANATTVLNIECLLDDKDVKSTITRSEFEVLVEPLVKRLTGPLEQALLNAKLTIQQVDAVELVGGSTRIPIVKETLANFFGGSINGENKLSTTLNLDEAVARGCALQCAIISPVFKVRDFTVVDWNAYPVILEWDGDIVPTPKEGEKDVSVEIFPVASQIPSAKVSKINLECNSSSNLSSR